MQRFAVVFGALAAVLAVAVPVGVADDGPKAGDGKGDKPSVTCAEPKPSGDECGQGELKGRVVAVSLDSVTITTSSGEGTKEWKLAVTADTVVRKNDQNVALADLKAGDYVRILLVRCTPSGKVRALRLVYLGSRTTT